MKFIGKFILHIIVNGLGIYLSALFISGFIFTGILQDLAIAATILTLINLIIRPILKLIFGPLIILTFGLFLIVINALTLYILDFFTTPLTIEGYLPLLYASLLIGCINLIFSTGGKALSKD